jgi:phospholipid transport system transporter-binding protein
MLILPATLTAREATDALRMLSEALDRDGAQTVQVDCSPLVQLDSSALAVLLECRRRAEGQGKSFELRGAPPKLAALATLYGVDGLLLGPPPPSGG